MKLWSEYGNGSTEGTWMDEEGLKKTGMKEKKKRGDIHQPLYSNGKQTSCWDRMQEGYAREVPE